MARKSSLMREKEREFGQPMEALLPNLVNEMGNVKAAEHLGITHGTVNRWLLVLGFRTQVVPVNGRQEAGKPP